MEPFTIILLTAAAICFLLGCFVLPSLRVNLVSLGLLFWVLVPLITAIKS